MINAYSTEQIGDFLGKHRKTIEYAVSALLCIAPTVSIIMYFSSRIFPWWCDGGIWLKQVNAMLGQSYPMWGAKPLQFDHIYLLLLASLKLLLRDDLLALKTLAVVIYALSPATTFVLARKLFNSNLSGLTAAFLLGFHPLLYETMGWGGYPNLLGYAILPLVMHSTIRCVENMSWRNLGYAGFMVALTAFSHNLTSIVLLGILTLWLLLAIIATWWTDWKSARKQVATISYSAAVVLSAFMFQFFIIGMPEYSMTNEAAFYKLRVGLIDVLWAVKNASMIIPLICLTIVAFIVVRHIRPKGYETYNVCMASWILAPLIMSQAYILGITVDYRRVFLFAFQPSLVMVAGPMALLPGLFESVKKTTGALLQGVSIRGLFRETARSLPATVLILLSLSFLTVEVGIGASYPNAVNDWYNHIDLYGDREKLQALEWIRHSTPEDAVFVSEEPFARWIEGLASRRVLMYAQPQYLFVKGEVDRSIAARSLLASRFELRNDIIRICDQQPYGNFTPLISFKNEGVYEDTLYINDLDSKVYLSNGTHEWSEPMSAEFASKSQLPYSILSNQSSASITTHYRKGDLAVERQIRMQADFPQASLSYDISMTGSSFEMVNLTIPLFSAEGRGFDEVYAESFDTIYVRSSNVRFRIVLTGEILAAVSIDSQERDMIVVSLKPKSNSPHAISGSITFTSAVDGVSSGRVVVINRDDLIRQYHVSYIALPRMSKPQLDGDIPLRPLTLPLYDHLLRNPAFRIAYENRNLIILQVLC